MSASSAAAVRVLDAPLPSPSVPEIDVDAANARLETLDALGRIEWAHATFGEGLVLSTSFGIQSAVMLHLATQVAPHIPVVFVDTGYLLPETYRFARDLTERLGLNLVKALPRTSAAEDEALYGKEWQQGREGLARYNFRRKVEPMNRALRELGATAWLAGLRRDQSSTREGRRVLETQGRTFKLHPIVEWTDRDVHRYLERHSLPYHPLWADGYVSVGDWHSSAPLTADVRPEDTRFGGLKRECGLHELSGRADFQI